MSYQKNANQNEGAVYTQGAVGISGGVRKDATGAPSGVADGDVHPMVFNQEGRLKVSAQPAIYTASTGTITASAQTIDVDVSRASNVMFYVTGTFSTVNCTFEGSIDGGTSWFTVQAIRSNANTIETTTGDLSAAPVYAWEASVNALTNFRLRSTAWASGTQNWTILPGAYATEPIPGAQVSATQPVSGTVTATIAAAATTIAKAEDAVHASGDVGVPSLAVRTDTPATTSSATGDYDILHTNSLGALQVAQNAHTNGGATPYMLISAASTNATSLKASAGQIYTIAAMNLNASPRYLKLYNKASAPTVGTDTPLQVYMIPGNTAGSGLTLSVPVGMEFGTGIAFAITTGIATSDTGAVAASEIVININYL